MSRPQILLLLLSLLNLNIKLLAQGDFRKGKIININKDSILGLIKYRGDIRNSLSCIFRKDSEPEKEFKPGEIYGYHFANGKYYVSKHVKDNEKVSYLFAEYLIGGKKNLYFLRDKKGFHFYIDLNKDTIIEIPYKEELVNKNGTSYKKESIAHKALLKSYFSECPALFPEIENMKRPDFSNMIKLTKEYYHVMGKSSYNVYYKKTPLKIFITPQFGTINFDHSISTVNQNNLTHWGALIYLWMPRANEHLYFKSGLLLSSFTTDVKYLLVKIPLQFEYLFRSKGVQPKIDFGVNYYSLYTSDTKDHLLTLACSTGAVVQLNKFIYLDIGVISDIWAFVYGTPFFVSDSMEIGLRIKL